jgi:hypothetical protein
MDHAISKLRVPREKKTSLNDINPFERMLSESGVTIVKFLLYISKAERARRFEKRLDDQKKNGKFSPDDLKERDFWDAYIEARRARKVQHRICALAYHPRESQVVPQPRRSADIGRDNGRDEAALPESRRRSVRDQLRVGASA